MTQLNMVLPEKGEIKWKRQSFPDGQNNIVIDVKTTNILLHRDPIQILTRINNFIDVELLICVVKSLNVIGFKNLHLYCPAFLGQRSDRKFEEGSNNYLKYVICPVINSLKLESVTVMDPHSHILEACIDNFESVDNESLVKWSLAQLYEGWRSVEASPKCILVSPDAGASHKIYKLADKIGYTGDVITCSKERDAEGKLSKCVVPLNGTQSMSKDLIIIDDICDGGRTFINIAVEIKKYQDNYLSNRIGKKVGKIYLIVTHGIFSNGFVELNKHFDGIYCTNSYIDMNDDEFSMRNDNKMYKLNQLNVF